MKKIFLLAFVFLLAMALVTVQAANDDMGNSENSEGNGSEMQEGSLISTQNQGEESEIQARSQIKSGTFFNPEGKELEIESGNGVTLRVRDIEAHSSLNMSQTLDQNRTRLHVQLSNGENTEIKVMPDTASETAIARLRLNQCNQSNNCTIELREVGSGEQVRAAYEIQAEKQVKVLGLFQAQMQVEAQIDAENGEVLQSGKPWWAFLAVE